MRSKPETRAAPWPARYRRRDRDGRSARRVSMSRFMNFRATVVVMSAILGRFLPAGFSSSAWPLIGETGLPGPIKSVMNLRDFCVIEWRSVMHYLQRAPQQHALCFNTLQFSDLTSNQVVFWVPLPIPGSALLEKRPLHSTIFL